MFDEMMNRNHKVNFDLVDDDDPLTMETPKPQSLWMLFVEAIQRYPRMQKLKDVIDKAFVEKDSFEQDEKRKILENYILQKQMQERRRKENFNKIQ